MSNRKLNIKALPCLLVTALLTPGGNAVGANLGYLRNTPISFFKQADMVLLQASIDKVLADRKNATPVAWANDKSGASGVVTALRDMDRGGADCREVHIENHYKPKALKAQGLYVFCRSAAGDWKLATQP